LGAAGTRGLEGGLARAAAKLMARRRVESRRGDTWRGPEVSGRRVVAPVPRTTYSIETAVAGRGLARGHPDLPQLCHSFDRKWRNNRLCRKCRVAQDQALPELSTFRFPRTSWRATSTTGWRTGTGTPSGATRRRLPPERWKIATFFPGVATGAWTSPMPSWATAHGWGGPSPSPTGVGRRNGAGRRDGGAPQGGSAVALRQRPPRATGLSRSGTAPSERPPASPPRPAAIFRGRIPWAPTADYRRRRAPGPTAPALAGPCARGVAS
jgi:hypothetical protein